MKIVKIKPIIKKYKKMRNPKNRETYKQSQNPQNLQQSQNS